MKLKNPVLAAILVFGGLFCFCWAVSDNNISTTDPAVQADIAKIASANILVLDKLDNKTSLSKNIHDAKKANFQKELDKDLSLSAGQKEKVLAAYDENYAARSKFIQEQSKEYINFINSTYQNDETTILQKNEAKKAFTKAQKEKKLKFMQEQDAKFNKLIEEIKSQKIDSTPVTADKK